MTSLDFEAGTSTAHSVSTSVRRRTAVRRAAQSTAPRDEGQEPIPADFTNRGILLRSTPTFLRHVPWGTREWKKAKLWRSWSVFGILWLCLACHALTAEPAPSNTEAGYRRWMPVILTSVLAACCRRAVYGDMTFYDPSTGGSSFTGAYTYHQPKGGRFRYGIFIAAIIIVAPLLYIPLRSSNTLPPRSKGPDGLHDDLFETRYGRPGEFWITEPKLDLLSGRTSNGKLDFHPTRFMSLLNWTSVETTLRTLPPLIKSHRTLADNFWVRDFNHTDNSVKTTFNLPGGGMGHGEFTWDNQRIHAVALPIMMQTTRTLGQNAALSWIGSGGQLVRFVLECELLRPTQMAMVPTGVEVSLVDSYDCTSTVRLVSRSSVVDHPGRVYNALRMLRLSSLVKGGSTAAVARVLEYLDSYLESLNRTSSLTAWYPDWRQPKGGSSVCRGRVFMAATSRSFFPAQTVLKAEHIRAASCAPRYATYNASRRGHFQYMGSKLQREPIDLVSRSLIEFDGFQTEHVLPDADSTEVEDPMGLLDEFLGHVVAFSSQPGVIPDISGQLESEVTDIYWARPVPVGALLMICDLLQSTFHQSLASSSALAILELASGNDHRALSGGIWDKTMPEPYSTGWVFRPFVFVWVQVFLLVWYLSLYTWQAFAFKGGFFIKALVAAIMSIFLYKDDCSSYQAPPPHVQSIAARAALLCNSRVYEMLQEIEDESDLVEWSAVICLRKWSEEDDGRARSGLYFDLDRPYHASIPYRHQPWRNSWYTPAVSSRLPHKIATIALFLYIVLFIVQTAWRWPRLLLSWNTYPVIHLMLERQGKTVWPGVLRTIYLYVLPAPFAFYLSFVWWTELYVFYCGRQPWASLKKRRCASRILTMRYDFSWKSFARAARNGHWVILFLSVGLLAHLAIPAFQANLFIPTWHSWNPGNITGTTTFVWRSELNETSVNVSIHQEKALQSTFSGLENWNGLPAWTTREHAFTPLDVEGPVEDVGLWMLNTSSLAGQLDCTDAAVSVECENGRSDCRVASVHLSSEATSTSAALSYPCAHGRAAGPLGVNASRTVDVHCGRWLHIQGSHSSSKNSSDLLAVFWLFGTAQRRSDDRDVLFSEEPTALGMLCKPIIKKTSGGVTISSKDLSWANSTLFEYYQSDEETLDASVSSKIGEGLTDAASRLGSLQPNGPLANTANFTGDVLAYAFYRFIHLPQSSGLNATWLARGSSLIFSTYFAALAQESDLFKEPLLQTTQIEPRKIEYFLAVNWPVFAVLIVFMVIWFFTLVVLHEIPEAYQIPTTVQTLITTEPLITSLWLIAQGSLVDMIQRRIPNVGSLSVTEVLSRISGWREEFCLGLTQVNGKQKYCIDLAENMIDEHEPVPDNHHHSIPLSSSIIRGNQDASGYERVYDRPEDYYRTNASAQNDEWENWPEAHDPGSTPAQPRPAAYATIEALPRLSLSEAGSTGVGECIFCTQTFGEDSVLTELPCGHRQFHRDCLLIWLGEQDSCPACRMVIPLVSELQEQNLNNAGPARNGGSSTQRQIVRDGQQGGSAVVMEREREEREREQREREERDREEERRQRRERTREAGERFGLATVNFARNRLVPLITKPMGWVFQLSDAVANFQVRQNQRRFGQRGPVGLE